VAPGSFRTRQYTFRLPDAPQGVGSLRVTVNGDGGNSVFEYNTAGTAETNNTANLTQTSTLAAYPDLQVSNVTLVPATGLESGGTLVVRWNDLNAGNSAATGPWHDRLLVENVTTGAIVASRTLQYTGGPLVAGGSLAREA